MAQLSRDEITHYRSQGWVSPQWRLPDAQVAVLRDALGELLRRNPGVRPEKLVSEPESFSGATEQHARKASGLGAKRRHSGLWRAFATTTGRLWA